MQTVYGYYTCKGVNVPAVELLGAVGAVVSGCPSSHAIFKGVAVKPLSFLHASSWIGVQNQYQMLRVSLVAYYKCFNTQTIQGVSESPGLDMRNPKLYNEPTFK